MDRMNRIWTLLWLLLVAVVGIVARPFWGDRVTGLDRLKRYPPSLRGNAWASA